MMINNDQFRIDLVTAITSVVCACEFESAVYIWRPSSYKASRGLYGEITLLVTPTPPITDAVSDLSRPQSL